MALRYLFMLLLALAACSPASQPTPLPQATAVVPVSGPEIVPVNPQVESASRPAWQSLPLTNARTGETFMLADFEGKTVFVEPMATWCTNCRSQQRSVIQADNQLNDDYVFISLSVAENVSDETLAQYANDLGFNWIFARATPELITELVNTFGRGAITPPSTPHFIVWADGSHTDLSTGQQSADEIVADLTSGT